MLSAAIFDYRLEISAFLYIQRLLRLAQLFHRPFVAPKVSRFENRSCSARLERQQCHRHADGMCGRRQRARGE